MILRQFITSFFALTLLVTSTQVYASESDTEKLQKAKDLYTQRTMSNYLTWKQKISNGESYGYAKPEVKFPEVTMDHKEVIDSDIQEIIHGIDPDNLCGQLPIT